MAFKIPNRIFVGGIAYSTTKEELKEFFDRYGAVRETKIIHDTEGLSKGFGFVTFYREEDARKVLGMGSIFFKEKRLNISEAYRKVPRTGASSYPVQESYSTASYYPGCQVYEPQVLSAQVPGNPSVFAAPQPGFTVHGTFQQPAVAPAVSPPVVYYYYY